MHTVTIDRAAAVPLMQALGAYTCDSWQVSRLEKEINEHFDEYLEPGADPLEAVAAAVATVRETLAAGGKVVIADGPLPPLLPVARKQSRGRVVNRPDRTQPYRVHKYSWKLHPVKRQTRKAGVMNSVIRELLRASQESPVGREYIHKVLCAEFPDRDPVGMLTNLRNLIPTRLREHYSIVVGRRRIKPKGELEGFGYWIVSMPPEKT